MYAELFTYAVNCNGFMQKGLESARKMGKLNVVDTSLVEYRLYPKGVRSGASPVLAVRAREAKRDLAISVVSIRPSTSLRFAQDYSTTSKN